MDNYVQSGTVRLMVDSLLILKNGYLIYESYPSGVFDANDKQHLYSSTKSVSSTLIGIAIDKGYIGGIDDYVVDFFPNRTIENMDSRKQAMTLEHLLTMTAGFQWEDIVNYFIMIASSDWTQYVLDQPMVDSPGSSWNYNTGVSHLLSAILEQVTPNGALAFAEEFLFEPLGITDYNWALDPQGVPFGGAQLYLNARDMAKLGFLYLMEGKWENQQIISKKWIMQTIRPSKVLPVEMEPYIGYGYQWWVLFWGKVYSARGLYEQNIFVIPDIDMVVVTSGSFISFDPTALLQTYIFSAAGYIILHPYVQLLILFPSLTLLFIIPFFLNNRGLKKKLYRA